MRAQAKKSSAVPDDDVHDDRGWAFRVLGGVRACPASQGSASRAAAHAAARHASRDRDREAILRDAMRPSSRAFQAR